MTCGSGVSLATNQVYLLTYPRKVPGHICLSLQLMQFFVGISIVLCECYARCRTIS